MPSEAHKGWRLRPEWNAAGQPSTPLSSLGEAVRPLSEQDKTLIDALLEEQHQLTAVEKFSRKHEQIPPQQKLYRELIPLSAPKIGEQYGFEVNLDSCSGCKACVTACHSLNGLDENETWRKVGVFVGHDQWRPVQHTITTACHHCVEPGCLKGCPVEAYEKDSLTGIVRHLDDQCIGCQYCSMTCPYDVPQYSKKRGIVRKCDMCSGRLASGEAPACVQACPNGAIAIRIVRKDDAAERARQNVFLPDAPDPKLTIPATRFISAKPVPSKNEAFPRDTPRTEPAHLPLVFMLVLTQMSAGIFFVDFLIRCLPGDTATATSKIVTGAGLAIAGSGIFASVLHLGRPLHAWRSFLGWRHSWLSREILAFGLFGKAAFGAFAASSIVSFISWTSVASLVAAATGLVAVFCSVMVYQATRRDFWSLHFTGGKFFGTAMLLGAATLWSIHAYSGTASSRVLAVAVFLTSLLKLGWETSFFRVLDEETASSRKNSALIMSGTLRAVTGTRYLLGFVGGVFLPFLYLTTDVSWAVAGAGLVLATLGELLERYLFFTAVAPPKMPGEN